MSGCHSEPQMKNLLHLPAGRQECEERSQMIPTFVGDPSLAPDEIRMTA